MFFRVDCLRGTSYRSCFRCRLIAGPTDFNVYIVFQGVSMFKTNEEMSSDNSHL